MTLQTRSANDGAADTELIAAVRSGDRQAFAVLYQRHRASAYHLAHQYVRTPTEADDIVSEGFAKVFNALTDGRGPDSAFRAYLLTSIRNCFYDLVRKDKRVDFTDDMEVHDPGVPFIDPAIANLDTALAARAFAKLPERWQSVLWHTEIEGESPAEVAVLMGMTPNAVAALAYRAREGLRQTYLQEHVADNADAACALTTSRLGAWTRNGLSKRELGQVESHLAECDRCAAVAAELTDLNSGLRGVVAVVAIGSAAATTAYLTGGTAAKLAAISWASGATGTLTGYAHVSALLGGAAGAGKAAALVGAGAASGAASGSSGGASGFLSIINPVNSVPGFVAAVVATAAAVAVGVVAVNAATGSSTNPGKSVAQIDAAQDGGAGAGAAGAGAGAGGVNGAAGAGANGANGGTGAGPTIAPPNVAGGAGATALDIPNLIPAGAGLGVGSNSGGGNTNPGGGTNPGGTNPGGTNPGGTNPGGGGNPGTDPTNPGGGTTGPSTTPSTGPTDPSTSTSETPPLPVSPTIVDTNLKVTVNLADQTAGTRVTVDLASSGKLIS
ncbi:MAG: sigma-70 family RNA polymerase sigma factor, partial [Antricoccus sp.]